VRSSRFSVFAPPSGRFRTLIRATGRAAGCSRAGRIGCASSQARKSAYRILTPRPLPSRWASSLPEMYALRIVRMLRCAIRAASAAVTASSSRSRLCSAVNTDSLTHSGAERIRRRLKLGLDCPCASAPMDGRMKIKCALDSLAAPCESCGWAWVTTS
jgi:hypothetical protein